MRPTGVETPTARHGSEIRKRKVEFALRVCYNKNRNKTQVFRKGEAHMDELAKVISTVWPQWQVEKMLGRGSYGRVYQVVRREQGAETRSAVKIISVPPDPGETYTLRSEGMSEDEISDYYRKTAMDFGKEIEMLRAVQDTPHVVGLEDYKVVQSRGAAMWFILIRMELLTPFQQYVAEHPLPEREVIRLGIEMCEALEGCHAKNIIHRDIKPQNIFADKNGSFKLGDFGIARRMEGVTVTMSQKGTFGYMAPEVAMGRKYNKKADICSLGLVMYQLANGGKAPFILTAEDQHNPLTRDEAMRRRLSGERLPAPSAVSPELAKIILKACEYDPEKRTESSAELKSALLRLAEKKKTAVTGGERKESAGNSKGASTAGAVSAEASLREAEKVRKHSETAGGARDAAGPDGANPSAQARKKGGKLPYIAVFAALAVVLIGGLIAVIVNLPPRRHARAEEFPAETRADRDAAEPADKTGTETEATETESPETEAPESDKAETVSDKPKPVAIFEIDPEPEGLEVEPTEPEGREVEPTEPEGREVEPTEPGRQEVDPEPEGPEVEPTELGRQEVDPEPVGTEGTAPTRLETEPEPDVPDDEPPVSDTPDDEEPAANYSGEPVAQIAIKPVKAGGPCGDSLYWKLLSDPSDDGIDEIVIYGTGRMWDYDAITTDDGFQTNAPWKEHLERNTEVTLESGITYIGNYAFYYCPNLVGELVIPDSVTSIGEGAFIYCSGFTGSLTIPDSVTEIEHHAFTWCSGFTGSLTIGGGTKSIGDWAFAGTGFRGGLTIGRSVVRIGEYAFASSRFTGSLTIPASVTSVGNQAFSGCGDFTGTLTIKNSETDIADNAFDYCNFSNYP